MLFDGGFEFVVISTAELVDFIITLDEQESRQRLDVVLFGQLGHFVDVDLEQ